MQNKYNKENYITFASDPTWWKEHVNDKTLESLSDYIKGSVLDIGCNHGATTYWLKDFNITDVTGVDVNLASLEYAEKNFIGYPVPYMFTQVDYTVDRIHKEYDTVISFHTLEHIYPEDVNKFVSNIYLSLKTGGYFLIGIPYERAYIDPLHVGFYNEQSLTDIMTTVGFSTVQCFKDDRWNEKNILTGIYKK